jgi:hypothetical protein
VSRGNGERLGGGGQYDLSSDFSCFEFGEVAEDEPFGIATKKREEV